MSGAILGAMSLHLPACSALLTSLAVQGTQRNSTSLLCESTHTNSSALVTFVQTVSSEGCRTKGARLLRASAALPLSGAPLLLPPPALEALVAVLLLSLERSVSCLMADLISSNPPPPGHGDCNLLCGLCLVRACGGCRVLRGSSLPASPPPPLSDMDACPDDLFSSELLLQSRTPFCTGGAVSTGRW